MSDTLQLSRLAEDEKAHSCVEWTPLVISPTGETTSGGRQLWRVDKAVEVRVGVHHFTIRAGFRCDFASVPRPLQPFLADTAVRSIASVAHDWLYFVGAPRAQADSVFYELLAACGIPAWQRWAMRIAVVLFGGGSYDNHRTLGHPVNNHRRFE